MLSKDFRGEIWTNVDARVMQAMVEANAEPVDGCVGGDSYCCAVQETVQSWFSDKIYSLFTINGTGANIVALKAMLDVFSSVVCTCETHINVYEAGAFEYTVGNKILSVQSPDGKLTRSAIEKLLRDTKKYKYIPKVAVISQPTELGTLYTLDELKELSDYVHSLGMYLYIDGARIGNAVCALQTTLSKMIEYADIDAFTIGGTKAGAMFGEMIVFRRAEFARHLDYIRKQSFQHFDKSKFLGVQFKCLFEKDIWLENAEKANKNAKLIERELAKKGIEICYPVETNMVFAKIKDAALCRLSEHFDLH